MEGNQELVTVYCLLAGALIGVNDCEKEQRPRACSGCCAATRRCKKCSVVGHITDTKGCLCGKCSPDERSVRKTNRTAESVGTALERLSSRMRKAGSRQLKIDPDQGKWRHSASPEDEIKPKPLSVEQSFALLCEHVVVLPNRLRSISAPLTVLSARARLAHSDGRVILNELRQQGLIVGREPWEMIAVVPEVKSSLSATETTVDDDEERDDDSDKEEVDTSLDLVGSRKRNQNAATPVLEIALTDLADKDGCFTFQDEVVGTLKALSRKMGVCYITLRFRANKHNLVPFRAKEKGGRSQFYYRLADAERACIGLKKKSKIA